MISFNYYKYYKNKVKKREVGKPYKGRYSMNEINRRLNAEPRLPDREAVRIAGMNPQLALQMLTKGRNQ